MPQIRIQRLGARRTKKNGAQYPEPLGIGRQQADGIMRAQSTEDPQIVQQMTASQYRQHGEPDKHDRPK